MDPGVEEEGMGATDLNTPRNGGVKALSPEHQLPPVHMGGSQVSLLPLGKGDKATTQYHLPDGQSRPMGTCLWRLMLAIDVAIFGNYPFLVHLCKVDGKIPFSTSSYVLLIESVKMLLCIVMFIPELRQKGWHPPSWRTALPYAVPAILYCFNNNLAIHMQTEMDPSSFQVLGNLKILSTAILYRLIIKRPITGLQWFALILLVGAGISNSYGGLLADPKETSAGVLHVSVKGLFMVAAYSFISGLAGVYSEYILKGKYEMSLFLQNGLLYSFGIILNASAWIGSTVSSGQWEHLNLLHGYSIYTWILIITQSFGGLIMSSVMKHGNNITRLFLVSGAMLLTTTLSVIFFQLKLNLFFCSSFVLVVLAIGLYHKK